MPNIVLNVTNQKLSVAQNFSPIIANSINYLFFQVQGLINKDWLGNTGDEELGDIPKKPLSRFAEFRWNNRTVAVRLFDYTDIKSLPEGFSYWSKEEKRKFYIEELQRIEKQTIAIPSSILRAPGFAVSVFSLRLEDLSDKEREELFNEEGHLNIQKAREKKLLNKMITTNVVKFDVSPSGALVIEDEQLNEEHFGEITNIFTELTTIITDNNSALTGLISENSEDIILLKEKDELIDLEIQSLKNKDEDVTSAIDELVENLNKEISKREEEDLALLDEIETAGENISILNNLFDWDLEFNILKDITFYVGDFDLETESFIPTIVTRRYSEYIPITNVRYSSNRRKYAVVFFRKEGEEYKFVAFADIKDDISLTDKVVHFTPPSQATHFVICDDKDAYRTLILQAEINYRTHKVGFEEDLTGAVQKIVDDIVGKALYQEY